MSTMCAHHQQKVHPRLPLMPEDEEHQARHHRPASNVRCAELDTRFIVYTIQKFIGDYINAIGKANAANMI